MGFPLEFWSNAEEITKVLVCKHKQWVHEWTKGVVVVIYHEVQFLAVRERLVAELGNAASGTCEETHISQQHPASTGHCCPFAGS